MEPFPVQNTRRLRPPLDAKTVAVQLPNASHPGPLHTLMEEGNLTESSSSNASHPDISAQSFQKKCLFASLTLRGQRRQEARHVRFTHHISASSQRIGCRQPALLLALVGHELCWSCGARHKAIEIEEAGLQLNERMETVAARPP